MGLTPYTKTQVAFPERAPSNWPPAIDAERLAQYELYDALIENRHQDVFADLRLKLDAQQASKIAIAIALPELLCNVWADAVWSDPPTIEWSSQALDDQWTAIDTANSFTEIGAWESVFSAAGWGHSVIRMYRDEDRKQREHVDSDVFFEEVPPGIFFPTLRKGSARQLEAVTLAWEEDRADPDAPKREMWQVRQDHFVEDGQYTIVTAERKATNSSDNFRRVGVEAPSGVDFLPFNVLHASRWRGRYWGVSELSRNLGIFDEVDNTISNVAEILEYHGKPVLQVPASVIYGGTLFKGADKSIGIRNPDEAPIARYITYDGQLDSQMASIDKNLELLFLTNEVPGRYFGLGGDAPPSGVAFKLALQNYLKKAARWQARERMRLRDLTVMALRLDGASDSIEPPKIHDGSPLPADDEAEARIETALVTAGLASQRGAMLRLRRSGTPDDVDQEIAEIDADKEANMQRQADLIDAAAAANPTPNSSTDPNADARRNPPA